MEHRERITRSVVGNGSSFFQSAETSRAKSVVGPEPRDTHFADAEHQFTLAAAILLSASLKSTETLLKHTFTLCGFKTLNCIDTNNVLDLATCPDVRIVVLDYEIIGEDYDRLLDLLRKNPNNLRVLVVGTNIIDRAKRILLEAGVHGCLALPTDLHMLLKAVKEISSGGLWFERSILNEVILSTNLKRNSIKAYSPPVPYQALTCQEQLVANYVGQGLFNKQIAEELDISVKTVKQHLTHIYQKFGISNRVQLTLLIRGD